MLCAPFLADSAKQATDTPNAPTRTEFKLGLFPAESSCQARNADTDTNANTTSTAREMKTHIKNLSLWPLLATGLGLILSLCSAKAQNNGMQYQIPTAEYNALVDLCNSTGGNAWTVSGTETPLNSNWLNGQTNSWYGVGVSGVQYDTNGNVIVQGHVTSISLVWNNLNGSIPTSLANLSQLQYLALNVNQLTGTIPSSLGNLASLQFINLAGNQLTGTIPSSLGNLGNLQYLALHGNPLTGTIPSSFFNLVNLRTLYLDCHLTGNIPEFIGNLSNLQNIEIDGNEINGAIPASLGNLTQLTELDLGNNQLTGTIPASLGNLINLQYINLGGNQLSGTIPVGWGNLPTGNPPNLYFLDLEDNCLTYDPGSANLLLMQEIGTKTPPPWDLFYGGLSSACTNEAMITGHVYCTCDVSPIAGATVMLTGNYSATSDSSGSYSISGIPPGTYLTIVSANNYISITNSITISSGSSTTQDFSLSPLPKLDYFGVGVNWANVNTAPWLRGDICATNLYNALQTDLSATFNQGTSFVVPLAATATSVNNLNTITAQFNEFKNGVCSNDTVVFYVDTHAGLDGAFGIQISLASDYNNNPVFAGPEIADLLNSLPSSTRKVVILDCCHAGGIANYLVGAVSTTSALAASSSTLEYVGNIVYGGTTPYYNDGTSVFTDALIVCLNNGVFSLNQIAADIYADAFGMYVSVIGQNLNLEDTGSAIFTGLQPQLWEGPGFTGDLASNISNIVSVPAAPPTMSQLTITNGLFQTTLTNMPTNGAVAIEMSTNLISWLQVTFYQAAGTNVTFTFPTTNNNAAFFLTKVVP